MSNFSKLPTISITRSKFNRNSQRKTSMKLGEITPIYLDEVLPGDTRKLDLGALIRMSTPVTPVMDNIFMDIYAFFVPNRLTWTHWKEFMGENNSSAGIYAGTAYTIPYDSSTGAISVGSVGDMYGLPLTPGQLKPSALPIRGYRLIYNRWFRDQNIIAPVVVNTGDSGNVYDVYNTALFKAAKKSDYFTRALPYAQKGAPVTLPLGGAAPVVTMNDISPSILKSRDSLHWATPAAGAVYATNGTVATNSGATVGVSGTVTSTNHILPSNLWADLSNATAATINDLRFAFQYQKLLEKDAMYGTRYWELLKAHFSVTPSDASLQDPQFLGHMRININVDQVVQTTGIDQATPAQNELGNTAAVSVTGKAGNLFTFSATEHGYLHILAVVRHDQTYGQGLERHWFRKNRTDFYFPVFANLGSQKVLNKEIYFSGNSVLDEAVFAYQESWCEYRYKNSLATGLLRPNVTGSLGAWTLANNFASLPTLSQSFIEQDRNALARVLQTGSTGPDFICDFAFKDVSVRPMPLYSVPGLIDHH